MDQATDLRALVRQVETTHAPPATRPRRILVFGGKGGVGTTTIAVNLAVALAHQGQSCLLCDAGGGDVAMQLRLEPRYTLADVLAGTRTLAQVLQSGPAGLRIVPSKRDFDRWHETTAPSWNRLLAQLPTLAPRPEVVVIDAGSRPDPLARQLWEAVDRVLLATSVETAAIMNAYASIKLLTDPSRAASIALVVNGSARKSMAEDAEQRLAHACRRFLGMTLRGVGHIPEDSAVPQSAARGAPYVLAAPVAPASLQLRHVARALSNHNTARQPAAA
jgi:flagellar biosynthesis protein FlhG